jgi:hypothetical protein
MPFQRNGSAHPMTVSAGSTNPRQGAFPLPPVRSLDATLALILIRGELRACSGVAGGGLRAIGSATRGAPLGRAYKHSLVGSLGRPSFIEAVQAMLPSTARQTISKFWSRSRQEKVLADITVFQCVPA